MYRQVKKFIASVQESDEAVKRRVAWLLTSASFFLILMLWGFNVYYQFARNKTPTSESDVSVIETVRLGASVIFNKITDSLAAERNLEVNLVGEEVESFYPSSVPLLPPLEFPQK